MKVKNFRFALILGNGYAMCNGELVSVVCEKQVINVNTERNLCYVKCVNGETLVLENGKGFYKSEYAFKEGVESDATYSIMNCVRNIICADYDDEDEAFEPYYWVFENGEPKRVTPTFEEVEINLDWDVRFIGCEQIPPRNDRYESREEAIKWNDYTVVDANGEKSVRKSNLKGLLLSDEQQSIVDELKAVLDRCESNNIRILYDYEGASLLAYNRGPKVSIIREFDYSSDEHIEICNLSDVPNWRFSTISTLIDEINDDDMFVLSKD